LDIRAYIASGILEQYVLGLTTPVETEEVDRLAQVHTEVQREIAEIRSSLETYALQFAQAPPADLQDRIWESLSGEKVLSRSIPDSDTISPPAFAGADENESVALQVAPASFWRTYGVAASFILLAVSILINLYLFTQLRRTKDQLAQANTQNSQLAQQMQVNQAGYSQLTSTLRFYQDPANQVIHLTGGPGKEDQGGMVVFWNQQRQQVYVAVHDLPSPPPGKQYQLWAIVDKKPVDAGVFTTRQLAAQRVKDVPRAQAFAVTLENEGGSPVPTGSILMVAEVKG
jgi:anti-sigma-K factor RskA